MNVGLDLLQVWIIHSPETCFWKNFLKSPLINMISLSLSFITVLKFYVLVKKSIPEMNEHYVAKMTIFAITVVSFVISCIKFLTRETKPTFNQVKSSMIISDM